MPHNQKLQRLQLWLECLVTDPNSAKGYRLRADELVRQGFSENHPMVTAYRKIADDKEASQ